ncbi:hypothetical protein [Cellulophaga sp. L1A9]|uniref:hypothetical protein n=1 Tax=Cellulophaga sp. L1A9 TaxID=2686362 RepID=UPI00131A7A10|nr:hypothetical protein [Cellulophaga sp. L1A9]
MSQYNETKFTLIKKWFKRNLTWVYFTIAIIFILFPNTSFSPFSNLWNGVLEKIGFVGLTSGVFASVLKSIQFTGLFQEELTKIISGSEFLNNRKDLPELWKKISKSICAQKFPEISDLLEDRILTSYFPLNKNHYNEDLIVSIVIHDINDDFVINYTQTIEYNAILDSEKNESTIAYTDTITDNQGVEEKNELLSFKIDGIESNLDEIKKEKIEEGKKIYFHEIPISGKKKFKIFLKVKNTYSLKGENVKLLRFNTITRNVDVIISHNKNIDVSFFNVGLVNDFVPIHTDLENTISRRHRDDLILPRQGFGLSFNKR